MIEWKNPAVEIPDEGRCVASLNYHNKSNWPLSAEIIFGIVEYGHGDNCFSVQTNDCSGCGSSYHAYGDSFFDECHAWAYFRDFNKPDWLAHDPHFDMFKADIDKEKFK